MGHPFSPLLIERLQPLDRILIAGAGGGFDIFAGLPLYFALRAMGKEVALANLSFTYLGATDAPLLMPGLARVTPSVNGSDGYFPEKRLAEWLEQNHHPATVYAFEHVGVRPLRAAYARLVSELDLQAIVLVDGGTDILMRGDEEGLGTPEEDMTSLAAVSGLERVQTFVASVGFGIDAFHGVRHTQVLQNIAALERAGGYLGAFSISPSSPEGSAFLSAVAWAQERTPARPSIVNGCIAAAVQGRFGDVQFTRRTEGSELFVNPLMSIYFTFDLRTLAQQSLYLPLLENTETIHGVTAQIRAFRSTVEIREAVVFPH